MNGPMDVRAVLDDAVPVYGSKFTHADFDATRAAVADLIRVAANVVADIRANKEPDLIDLADCIKAVGGRDALKAALSKVQGNAYTLADHAREGGAA